MLVEQPQEVKEASGDTQVEKCKSRSLTYAKGDVVILYESNVEENATDVTPKPRPPNQYVETIVYEEDSESECSEISESYTKEDLNELCLINSEALDFINNIPSVDTPLCHKQNQMKIKPSGFIADLTHPFERPYFFNSFGSLLSTSLMDILCSNQKNDNYVCYMDNLISHVQYTIEELKRISNGEYLSERTKRKWIESTEVLCAKAERNKFEKKKREKTVNNKIMSQLLIVPYEEHKDIKMHKALSDIITGRSEINTKVLNNILRKKVVIDVPKVLKDPVVSIKDLTIVNFIKNGTENNCIRRDKISHKIITSDLRYPILTLSCGIFNVSVSIQNLNLLNNEKTETNNNLLAIKYQPNENNFKKEEIKVIEENYECEEKQEIGIEQNCGTDIQNCDDNLIVNDDDSFKSELNFIVCKESIGSYLESIATLSSDVSFPSTDKRDVENHSATSISLGCSVQQVNSKLYLNIKTDGNLKIKKKSSPTIVKIKSPYENNSHELDEKKRKRLLKIRERRQKIKKIKENAGQALNSETKLILTGKSFSSFEDKENKKRYKKRKNKFTAVKHTKSYMENMKPFCSDSSSPITIRQFSQFMEPLVSPQDFKNEKNNSQKITSEDSANKENNFFTIDSQQEDELAKLVRNELYSQAEYNNHNKNIADLSKYNLNKPPVNTPIESLSESSKSSLSKECKNNIDKLYTFIKELTKIDNSDNKEIEKRFTTNCTETVIMQNNIESISAIGDGHKLNTTEETSTTQHSHYNLEKIPWRQSTNNNKRKIEIVAHMPKVSLPPKKQTEKYDKSVRNPRKNDDQQPKDTLKAISELLYKIDYVKGMNLKTDKVTNVPNNTCETVRQTKKNTRETVKESRRKVPALSSSKIVKSEDVMKENNNICKGNMSTVKTQTTEKLQPKQPEIKKKENDQNITESTEAKESSKERVLWRPRLDALAQPKKTHFALNNKGVKIPNTTLSATTRPQRNASLIPQRIKNIISQNKTPPPLSNSTLVKASPRTQEEAESKSPLSNSFERKRLKSENKLQIKINNDLNASGSLKKNIAEIKNRVKFNLEPHSRKRKEFKKLQKPTISVIKEQDNSAIPESKKEDTDQSKLTIEANESVDVNVQKPLLANNEDNEVLSPLKSTNVISTHLNQSKSDEIVYGSDYKIDVFEDGNISTAVANIFTRNITVANSRIFHKKHNFLKSQGHNSCSLTRLEKRPGPVNSQTIIDQTVLKTLSPNRSFQQMFVLQSGDTGSLMLKSSLSQDIKTLDIVPKLSFQTFTKSSIDWTPQTLSLHYFPAMHSIKYCKSGKTLNKYAPDTCHKSICKGFLTKTSVDIFHDVGKVSNENHEEPISENMIQSRTDSVLNDISNVSQLQIINSIENSVDNTDSVFTSLSCDRSTSMDILVELINEIKTISTYHANISLEQILKQATGDRLKNDDNKILSELGLLKKCESQPSIHSYFVNDEFDANENKLIHADKNTTNGSMNSGKTEDKEVSAWIKEQEETVKRCTDVPSRLLPVTITDNSVSVSTSSTFLNKAVEASTATEVIHSVKKIRPNSTKNVNWDSTRTAFVDQHLKLKRDILMSVYFILVLTVFVALTFPDIQARF
ncbi:uncharacterized protein LOC121734244 isoform X2 [Aricia agestis]|uniref:uncharacterized protein LOC121734244 isoform X2 n=1 Tax=Aricia agestis TaxID=91739 RepID=UPI001C201DA0|nr:uncharacterized protein LOC121734244 isoform X2 [Aricia agestis]